MTSQRNDQMARYHLGGLIAHAAGALIDGTDGKAVAAFLIRELASTAARDEPLEVDLQGRTTTASIDGANDMAWEYRIHPARGLNVSESTWREVSHETRGHFRRHNVRPDPGGP